MTDKAKLPLTWDGLPLDRGADAAGASAGPGAFDRLSNEARISAPDTRRRLTPEESEQLAGEIRSFCSESGLSQNQLARMAGTSGAVVSQALAGRYRGDAARVLEKLLAAIQAERARRADQADARIVETAVVRAIFTLAKTAMSSGRICVAHGASGIGKSSTLRAIARKFPQAVLLEINDGCAAPATFYQQLLQAVVRRAGVGTRASHFRRLVGELSGSHRLIMLDEAESLTMAGFSAVRQLHDATGCPVLLVGRPPLMDKLRKTRDDPRIGGGLLGRILTHRAIDRRDGGTGRGDRGGSAPLFSEQEIVEMIARWEVRLAPAAGRWLSAVANLVTLGDGREGCGLRYALSLVELAVKVNKGQRWLTLEMLQEVNRELLDSDYVRAVESEIDAWSRRQARVG